MVAAAAATVAAGLTAWSVVRPGPLLQPSPRPRARYALAGFRSRRPRQANLGYFGHMWALYASWTWVPAFVAAGRGLDPGTRDAGTSLVTFVTIGVAGLAGALLGGWAADRFGRPAAAVTALLVSGACCLVSPAVFGAPGWLLVFFLCVWGASVIADSGVFSTALSETADQRHVGTALTVQPAIGFSLTVVTIQLVPVLAGTVGWQYAFWLLAPGPLLGAVAMSRFARA